MGGNQSEISSIGTLKGQGYRILSVKPNSPLQPLVDPFFDFIVDVIPTKETEKSPKDILSKLTENDNKRAPKRQKNLQQIFKENQNSVIVMKIVSTKYRNVKTVQVTPNSNWSGPEDLMGLSFRLQRYDEAFQTYFPFSDVRPGSPVKKSGINEGEYLIGCLEFQYNSINELLQNLYDRYFDKAVQNKTVNFAVYNLLNDGLRLVPVLLARGWGEKGLLGCEFLEGHLNKFPKNLLQMRDSLKLKKKISDDNVKIKKQLSECNGASVQLIESLKNQKYRKKKNIKHLKNILLIEPSQPKKNTEIPQIKESLEKLEMKQQRQVQYNNKGEFVPLNRFKQLQNRVATLEQMLSNVRNYIQQIQSDDEA